MSRSCHVPKLLALLASATLFGCRPTPEVAPPPRSDATVGAPGWQHGDLEGDVFYQVFVRSFRDADGDGVGDLAGLIERLDYLNDGDPATDDDLGVDGLWLMPVFESPSYHGYDVVDYEAVDAEYGTRADLARLLEAAHERGMRVIVDLVVNHTGSDHPWFQAAASSPESPYRSWYVWRDDDPGWTQPWGSGYPTWHALTEGGPYYYGIFWGGMPDLNYRSPAVREEMLRIVDLWLAFGLDGFRLDATRHLFASGDGDGQNDQPETHAFLRELSAHVRASRPRTILVGENWTTTENIAPYYGDAGKVTGGDELPMSFDFPLAEAVVAAARGGDPEPVIETLARMAELYPPEVLDAPFLRNHDQIRLATVLGEDPGRLRTAAAMLLTLPGVPFLYYGEEVGLANGGPGSQDELKRTPMPWNDLEGGGFTSGAPWHSFAPGREAANVASQSGEPDSLLSHYRRWIRVRQGSAALRRGSIQPLSDADPPLLAYLRVAPEERVLVAHNLGDTPIIAELALEASALRSLTGAEASPVEDRWRLSLAPFESAAWRVEGAAPR